MIRLLVAFWLAAGAWAQVAPDVGRAAEVQNEETALVARAAEALRDDASMRDSLARRLLASSLADQLSGGETDPEKAKEAVAQWIAEHPEDAANLAVGFAKDDESGTKEFEISLRERVSRSLALNPERYHGILGVLSAAGKESKLIKKLEKKMDEEEQRELVKRLFEGQGGEQGRVLKQPEGDGKGSGSGGGASPSAVAGSSAYDRLSELNPSGYSPEVLSLQSQLNAQRPPGAPKLIETGRLDYTTLAYPTYALRSDLGRQSGSAAAREAWAVARALGREREFTAEQYSLQGVQASLAKAGKGVKLPPRVVRRKEALERARAAIAEFEAEAARMQQPSAIHRAGLRTLSAKQKEASRWLVIASLEADVERLEAESGFWTADLENLVKTAPAAEHARQAFLGRGKAVRERLARIQARDQAALAILLSSDYAARWRQMEGELAEGNRLRQGLSRDIQLVSRVPGQLHSAYRPVPRWRAWLESALIKLAPTTRIAREASARERRASGWSEAFGLVAAGDFVRAQRAADEASR
ncbi:MAG: hypothetical protein HY553_11405 [Elusimicrobia bacterium]|nr:hypothetical protein [Elusimicrobiota bacterium]